MAPPDVSAPKEGKGLGGTAASSVPFTVRDTAPSAPPTEVKASPALEGIRSGALDMNGYLDAKVHEATAHLSQLSPTQLATVQGVVRAQLTSDPHLLELVQQATGRAAPKDDD